jgi:hypothetical protein
LTALQRKLETDKEILPDPDLEPHDGSDPASPSAAAPSRLAKPGAWNSLIVMWIHLLRASCLAATLLLAGASAGCSDTNCSIAGPRWPDRVGPWPAGINAFPDHAQLRLGDNGEIGINLEGLGFGGGWRRVGSTEMHETLDILDGKGSSSYLVVDVSPKSSCARVRALSKELEQLAMCREGWCLKRSAWENYKGE